MKCIYHQSPEIYEDYLLNRLSEEEKEKFESHLTSCLQCQKELDFTRMMITGIREIGRQEMKAEIRRQVEQRQLAPAGFNWGILLRAAAVLLFLVIAPGMIYYYWYFLPTQQKVFLPSFKDTTDLTAEGKSVLPSPPEGKLDLKEEHTEKHPLIPKDKLKKHPELDQQLSVEKEVIIADNVPARKEMDREKRLAEESLSPTVTAGTSTEALLIQPEEKRVTPVFIFDSIQIQMNKGVAPQTILTESANKQHPVTVYTFWQYRQKDQTIQISVPEMQKKVPAAFAAKLPEKFPVRIISTGYPNLHMIWQLDTSQIKFDPTQIQMMIDSSNYIMVHWPSGAIYRIDTRQQNTEAVRIKP